MLLSFVHESNLKLVRFLFGAGVDFSGSFLSSIGELGFHTEPPLHASTFSPGWAGRVFLLSTYFSFFRSGSVLACVS